MIMECFVIFTIILAITIIFIRTNKDHALQAVPLLILPGVNILGYFFSQSLSRLLPLDHFSVYVIMTIAAVIVSGILSGIFSARFKTKPSKVTYIAMCIIFNIVLASILVQNLYQFYKTN